MGEGLVGREEEVARLLGWWDDARLGRSRLVLVAGEAGVGKTTLALELSSRMEPPVRVAWARCHEDAAAPPYWLWRRLLHDLDVMVPSLESGSFDDRDDWFDAVTGQLVEAAAGEGALVVIDDIQWADEPSLALLRHLLGRVRQARLLIVGTCRPVGPQAAPVLADLLRDPTTERIDVRGFDDDETAECLASMTGHPVPLEVARRVQVATGGNPFYVREVGRTGVGDTLAVPPTVVGAIAARVGRLDQSVQDMLRVAAVIGDEFSVAVLAALVERPATSCLDLLDEARRAGFVTGGDVVGTFRFAHALVRMAVEEALPSVDRAELHRRAALAIESLYADDLVGHLTELARHWAAAAVTGEHRAAYVWAERAAAAAMDALAFEEAARLHQLALDAGGPALTASDRCATYLGRAAAMAQALDLPGGNAAIDQAMAAARASADPALVAASALALECVGDRTWDGGIRARCEEALDVVRRDDTITTSRLLARLAEALVYQGEHDRGFATSGDALELAEASGDRDAIASALRARQLASAGPEHAAEREQLARRMIELGMAARRPRDEMWGRLWLIDVHLELGQLREMAAELSRLRACAARVGGPFSQWHVLIAEAALAQVTARFDAAVDHSRRAFELLNPARHPAAFGAHMAGIGSVKHHVGSAAVPMPFDTMRIPPDFAPDPSEVRAQIFMFLGPAFELAEEGFLDEARTLVARAGPVPSWTPPPYFVVAVYAMAARVFGLLGDLDVVSFCVDKLEAYRGQFVTIGAGAGSSFGPVELTLGRAERELGRLETSEADLTVALSRCRQAGADGFAVEAACELAATMLLQGRSIEAATLAVEAEQDATGLGMRPWAAHARATIEAAANAEHPGPAASASVLSAREMEVAQLVAAGDTNQQIADALFVSVRTAQNHVQHILTKLGFTSRSQIAAWVARRNE